MHKLRSMLSGETHKNGAMVYVFRSRREAVSCLKAVQAKFLAELSGVSDVYGGENIPLGLEHWWGLFEAKDGQRLPIVGCGMSLRKQGQIAAKCGGLHTLLTTEDILKLHNWADHVLFRQEKEKYLSGGGNWCGYKRLISAWNRTG